MFWNEDLGRPLWRVMSFREIAGGHDLERRVSAFFETGIVSGLSLGVPMIMLGALQSLPGLLIASSSLLGLLAVKNRWPAFLVRIAILANVVVVSAIYAIFEFGIFADESWNRADSSGKYFVIAFLSASYLWPLLAWLRLSKQAASLDR